MTEGALMGPYKRQKKTILEKGINELNCVHQNKAFEGPVSSNRNLSTLGAIPWKRACVRSKPKYQRLESACRCDNKREGALSN